MHYASATRRLHLFLLMALLLTAVGYAAAVDQIEQPSARSFDDTVQQLKWAFGGYGMTTTSALDYQHVLSEVRVDVGRAVMFEVMRRDWAKLILREDAAMGIVLPVRVYVYERADGTTVVAYHRPGAALEAHERETLRTLGSRLDDKLRAMVRQATGRPDTSD
jgi:uncharacterized protein (DUF302 family)